jgi:AAHS family 4-hydroxybenzoate transporter-like MFS transporter
MRATGTGWAFGVGRIGSILGPVLAACCWRLIGRCRPLFLFVAAPALCVAGVLLPMRRVAGNYPQHGGAT